MADKHSYFFIKNYSSNGDMAISRHVFEEIVLNTIKKIKGVTPFKGEGTKKNFNLYHPVTCSIRKDNRVDINVDVSVKKNIDVKSTCIKIQEEINNALMLSCETVAFNVNINVASILE